jgi:hypothetical protein
MPFKRKSSVLLKKGLEKKMMSKKIDIKVLEEELKLILHNAELYNGAFIDDQSERKERSVRISNSLESIKRVVDLAN